MSFHPEARRANLRALLDAAVLGSAVALAVGGAYWAGGSAREHVAQARIAHLADAARGGFSEASLKTVARDGGAPDAGVLAIADRLAPMAAPASTLEGRRLAALQARLVQARATVAPPAPLLIRTAYAEPAAPALPAAAHPFRLRGALDETRDLECLAQAVYYEARGETTSGQAAVAQVVLNRVRHRAFPKTVCGVVFQHTGSGCQFSFACKGSGKLPAENASWLRSKAVAARALEGAVMTEVGDATHFHAGRGADFSGGLLKVAQIGAHAFYRFAGRAGSPGMFSDGPAHASTTAEAPRVFASFAPISGATAGRMLAAGAQAVEHAVGGGAVRVAALSPASTAPATAQSGAKPVVQVSPSAAPSRAADGLAAKVQTSQT